MSFLVNDIRPQALDELRVAAQESDLAWLKKRLPRFTPASCPACDSDDKAGAYDKFDFHWDRCLDCGTAFMNPRPTVDILADFYAQSALYKVWDEHIFPSSKEVRRERIFRPRVERMLDFLDRLGVRAETLFEVGAAHGIFCDEAKRSGRFSRVVAIEPSSVQAQTCRDMGVETIEAAIEDVDDQDAVADVVAAFEVIEHLSEPWAFVQAMKRLLKPNGLLILSTPNVQGFEILTLGAKSDSIYPEHVTLFSLDGIKRMVARAGLTVIELSTPGVLDCDIVRTKVLAGAIDLSQQPFLRKNLIDEWDRRGAALQDFIASSGQSSHMWLVAQQIG